MRRYARVDANPQIDWVVVHDVRVGTGWNRTTTDVLINLGPGYPNTPPDNFYVPSGLRLSNGATPTNFQPNAFTHMGTSWDMFSWHHESGWIPAAVVTEGSSLVSFMLEVERRLAEVD